MENQQITAGRKRKYHGINTDFCTGKIGYDTIGSDDILWAEPVGIFSRQCGNEGGQGVCLEAVRLKMKLF